LYYIVLLLEGHCYIANQELSVALSGDFAGDNFAGFAEGDQPPQCTLGHSHKISTAHFG